MRGNRFALALLVLIASACGSDGSDGTGPEDVTRIFIEVAPSRATVGVGETTTITAEPWANVMWSSSSIGVATVDGAGLVTGVAEGTATITVMDGDGHADSMTLTVGTRAVIWRQVSAGSGHTCGLATDGRAFCWGTQDLGRLGNGVAVEPPPDDPVLGPGVRVPVPVSGGLTFESISAGSIHTCGVVTDGRAFCWGGGDGALGNGSTDGSAVPVEVTGGLTFASVSAASGYTCGVTTAGEAYCWGSSNGDGRLGNGSTTDSSVPLLVSGGLTFESISADVRTCGVTTTAEAYCWGSGQTGALGNGSTNDSSVPVPVSGGLMFASVSVGGEATCGLTTVNERYCWGNHSREVEVGFPMGVTSVPVSAGDSFKSISLTIIYGCGVTVLDRALCWGGVAFEGSRGDGKREESRIPVEVLGGHAFESVAVESFRACAVTTGGRAFCWGDPQVGTLGNGALGAFTTPAQVSDP